MRLEPLGSWDFPPFDRVSLRVEGYVLLGLYGLLFLYSLYKRRNDFRSVQGRRMTLFFILLLLTVPLNNLLWLRFSSTDLLPPPGVPTAAPEPSVPLLGALTILLAGALLGAGPAMFTGLLAGLVRGGLDSSRVFAPSELATFGLIAGLLLQQAYRGHTWRLLRQPAMAGLISAVCHWVLLGFGIYSATSGSSLSALDYTRSILSVSVGAVAIDALLAGLLVQGLYLVAPGLKPPLTGISTPPHLRSMNRRLLTALIPLTLVTIPVMFYAVTTAAVKEATNQTVAGMIRNANAVAEMIPMMFNTGQEILKGFAAAEQLRNPNPVVRDEMLEASLKVGPYGPFFTQLILTDQQKEAINYYPQEGSPPRLSSEEEQLLQRTLSFGSPERSHVFEMDDERLISFIAPVEDENGQLQGALIGRSRLDVNPMIRDILSTLGGTSGSAPGYVVDDRGLGVFHPGDDLLLPESIDPDCPEISGLSTEVQAQAQGRTCQNLGSGGTRRLVYYLPIEALGDWTVVITHPYEDVLDRATRISRPSLLILLLVSGALVLIVSLVTDRLTRRLKLLATATHSIAQGQLDHRVTLTGEDEVGQLGQVFEQMRVSLKARLEDLSLLLRVSQAVSSSLDMDQGVPAILEGALQATEARSARLILFDDRGDPQFVIAQGEGRGYVTAVDRAMARLGQEGKPITIEDVARARGLIERGLVGPDIKALITVPMRSKDHDVGVMWLGYDEVHQFKDTEVDFLSTLTSQAAVAVENAKLFQAIAGERRRLAAILESTSDAVIVTDHADRVLLLNPAAAQVFRLDPEEVTGAPIAQALQEEKVIHLLTATMDAGSHLTDEVRLPDDRTLYASTSVIVTEDGQTIGRVAVLRDITHLKKLDEMKSEFVSTVSHDLRAPLTYMRGYAAMISMMGDVSPLQQRYIDKITAGIEQMTEIIDDLLGLRRIEAGLGLRMEPCRIAELVVTTANAMRARAKAKGLTMQLNQRDNGAVVVGDAALLRRAVSNLIDNAIKYTDAGGTVTVSWDARGDRVLISVADTGIGIAKADQVHLFEKFSRIRRRETEDIKGSGLGLAIVKSIVDWHNGRVWVESELDRGSTFFVELPTGTSPRDQV